MYCLECGKEISDGSNFCQYCGANLKEHIMTNENINVEEAFHDEYGHLTKKWIEYLDKLPEKIEIDINSFKQAGLKVNTCNFVTKKYSDYVDLYCDITNFCVRQGRSVELKCKLYDSNNKILGVEEEYLYDDDFNTKSITFNPDFDFFKLVNVKKISIYAIVGD